MQGSIYSALCCEVKWMNLTIAIFAICTLALNCQNTSQNACYGCKKQKKSNPIRFIFDGRKFWGQCVNVIDIMWGHIYFSTCEKFGRKFCPKCAMTFTPKITMTGKVVTTKCWTCYKTETWMPTLTYLLRHIIVWQLLLNHVKVNRSSILKSVHCYDAN